MKAEIARAAVNRRVLWALLAAIGWGAPALGGGGEVMPPTASPKGYSLQQAAAATAVANEEGVDPSDLPFQMLHVTDTNTFDLRPGTMLYIPVAYTDDSDPILGDFPDPLNRAAVANYYFNPKQLGVEYLQIIVDGKVTALGPGYAAGTYGSDPSDDAPWHRYTVVAAFLTPLSKGTHTVTIQGFLDGNAIRQYLPDGFEFEDRYTVNVR